ncbi:glycoside hydrolase family 38 C-terminal domain-containing protein, partial [Paenibacillus sp.]|uniref:glycoside hydrolase family 38 N-terminal domain-containing protein n=1 Tax=Paenibacillus sp. TaxID=58172 RepID=UPI002D7493B5
MTNNQLHLICNAHLDPAWLWEIEEGAGEALSTFRIAADFCEAYGGFVFNHNEVVLYEWIEEYDPALFERIVRLVREGKWHIMGGWYLQPDCNMPSGESFVRQMLVGRKYFAEKFGARPTTAINFDPFGHTRGLVQIMAKAGFDAYIVCRPAENDCPLPAEDFQWIGFDGSSVTGHRAYKAYLSGKGKARNKVEGWLNDHPGRRIGMVLWGIGNHGGGPSRIDLEQLSALAAETAGTEIVHSTPEAYFRELRASGEPLPVYEGDLNAWAVGCYTSQIRIKQKHRQLENELYAVERMASHAALVRGMAYPAAELKDAQRDLLLSQFHDMLPGSSVKPVEDATLRLLSHGLEIVSRVRMRAFFALAEGFAKAEEDTVPVFVYNPHPFPAKAVVVCEFQLPESARGRYAEIVVHRDGARVPAQTEKEISSLYIEWRKRVVFEAELAPMTMSRFDCTVEWKEAKAAPARPERDGALTFANDRMEFVVNAETGLVDRWVVDGVDIVRPNAFEALVLDDFDDSWGSCTRRFDDTVGAFKLLSKAGAMKLSGLRGKPLPRVRVVEDGDVRTVVEALFGYGRSTLAMRYFIPKRGAEVELELTVHWNEARKLLKLSVPTAFGAAANFLGQTAFGTMALPSDGREVAAQKWVAVSDGRTALTSVNDGTYGFDCRDGELRLSLLRSPGYSALPGGGKTETMPKDRRSDRIDQGERTFRFWFAAGPAGERLRAVDREAAVLNEKPYALSYFPSGTRVAPAGTLAELADATTVLSAWKRAEDGDGDVVRVYNPTAERLETTLRLPIHRVDV